MSSSSSSSDSTPLTLGAKLRQAGEEKTDSDCKSICEQILKVVEKEGPQAVECGKTEVIIQDNDVPYLRKVVTLPDGGINTEVLDEIKVFFHKHDLKVGYYFANRVQTFKMAEDAKGWDPCAFNNTCISGGTCVNNATMYSLDQTFQATKSIHDIADAICGYLVVALLIAILKL